MMTIAGSLLAGGLSSCGDSFLDEEQITVKNTDYFKTPQGVADLSVGAYTKLCFRYNYAWAYTLWHVGVDEFTEANNQANTTPWNCYTTGMNSSLSDLNSLWDNMYGLIEPANILLANTPTAYAEGSENYKTYMGEGYFFRAFATFELVKSFGGVPLKLQPSTSVERNFIRNTAEECFKQIISDFEQAYNLLPTEGDAYHGKLTKWAAAHFLAKAHLFRASELNDSWNSSYKADDLEKVIKYGDEVISHHPLCNDFVELWDFQKADGDNEKVSEVVLSAQFSDNSTTWGRFGNQIHLCYPSVYQNMAGTKRDISDDREFSYCSATEYTMQVFDRVNDSRFWKSFITTYGCNNTAGAPAWSQDEIDLGIAPAGVQAGDKRFVGGDLAIKYIVNDPGDTRYENVGAIDANAPRVTKDGKMQAQHTFVRYFKGQGQNWNTNYANTTGNYYQAIARSVALSKWRDGYRNAIASQFGVRDAIIARSAEDVLMVAEAYIRKGEQHYGDAIRYFNMLRERAGYYNGEDRSKHVDGGQSYKNNPYCEGKGGGFSADGAIYYDTNTYYESNNMEGQETTASTKNVMKLNNVNDIYNSTADAPIYAELGCGSNAEKMMCFLLNERTRELCGEGWRWEDLARTKTLGKRWNAFNNGSTRGLGSFDESKHYLRPIPQVYLDANFSTDAEKEAEQNPGY